MKITRSYEQLVSFGAGSFENAKVGITLSSETDCKSVEEIKTNSNKLLKLAKSIVEEEVTLLKQSKGIGER